MSQGGRLDRDLAAWHRGAIDMRRARGDDLKTSIIFAELVVEIARHIPLAAGLLLGAEKIYLSKNASGRQYLHAVFFAHSIRGAMLTETRRARMIELAESLGTELSIEVSVLSSSDGPVVPEAIADG